MSEGEKEMSDNEDGLFDPNFNPREFLKNLGVDYDQVLIARNKMIANNSPPKRLVIPASVAIMGMVVELDQYAPEAYLMSDEKPDVMKLQSKLDEAVGVIREFVREVESVKERLIRTDEHNGVTFTVTEKNSITMTPALTKAREFLRRFEEGDR